jgi:hypothetical protein
MGHFTHKRMGRDRDERRGSVKGHITPVAKGDNHPMSCSSEGGGRHGAPALAGTSLAANM